MLSFSTQWPPLIWHIVCTRWLSNHLWGLRCSSEVTLAHTRLPEFDPWNYRNHLSKHLWTLKTSGPSASSSCSSCPRWRRNHPRSLLSSWRALQLCPTPPWWPEGGKDVNFIGSTHHVKPGILACSHIWTKCITFLRELNSPDRNTSSPPSNLMTWKRYHKPFHAFWEISQSSSTLKP